MAYAMPLASQRDPFIHSGGSAKAPANAMSTFILVPQTSLAALPTPLNAAIKVADAGPAVDLEARMRDPLSETESGGQSSQTAQAVGSDPAFGGADVPGGTGGTGGGSKGASQRLRPTASRSRSGRQREGRGLERGPALSIGEHDTASTLPKPGPTCRKASVYRLHEGSIPGSPGTAGSNTPTSRKRRATSASCGLSASWDAHGLPSKSAEEKAAEARARAQELTQQAEAAMRRAVELIRVAQFKALQEARAKPMRGTPGASPVKAAVLPAQPRPPIRISLASENSHVFNKASIVSYDARRHKHLLQYDSGRKDWLDLRKHRFQWLTPRAISAGSCASLHEEMVQLGAQKLVKGSPAAVAPQVVGRGPLPEEAVGWFLELYNASECSWHLAEVLAYRKSRRLHHLLYKDGEDEWVNLTREAIRWTQAAPLAPLGAGLRPGESAVWGQAAVGWKVGVYWLRDCAFHPAVILQYIPTEGKHVLEYRDTRTREKLNLNSEKVKWLQGPALGAASDAGRRTTAPALQKASASGEGLAHQLQLAPLVECPVWSAEIDLMVGSLNARNQDDSASALLDLPPVPAVSWGSFPACTAAETPVQRPGVPQAWWQSAASQPQIPSALGAQPDSLAAEEDEACLSFTPLAYTMAHDLDEPVAVDLPLFSEPLMLDPRLPAETQDPKSLPELAQEEPMLDPAHVLALAQPDGIKEGAEPGSRTGELQTKGSLKGHPSLISNQSDSSLVSDRCFGASAPASRADSLDPLCDSPQALCLEPYDEPCIHTLLGPPPEYGELFADLLLPRDSYDSFLALA